MLAARSWVDEGFGLTVAQHTKRLSPSARHLAVVDVTGGRLRVVTLATGATQDIPLSGPGGEALASLHVDHLRWRPDGGAVFVGLGRDLTEIDLTQMPPTRRIRWHAAKAAINDVRPLAHGLVVRIWRATEQAVVWLPYASEAAFTVPTQGVRVVGMGALRGDDFAVAVTDAAGTTRFDTYRTAASGVPTSLASYPCEGDCVPHNWAPGARKPVFTTLAGQLRLPAGGRIAPAMSRLELGTTHAHSLWLVEGGRAVVVGYQDGLHVIDTKGKRLWSWQPPSGEVLHSLHVDGTAIVVATNRRVVRLADRREELIVALPDEAGAFFDDPVPLPDGGVAVTRIKVTIGPMLPLVPSVFQIPAVLQLP